MNLIIAIAAGGAMGAVLRHFMSVLTMSVAGFQFPWGTLSVNIIGSFLMGALIAYFAHHWNPPQEIRAFLTVGLLGGFTTFSAFSLDFVNMWERGDITSALLYVLGSFFLSIFALFAGLFLIRQVFA